MINHNACHDERNEMYHKCCCEMVGMSVSSAPTIGMQALNSTWLENQCSGNFDIPGIAGRLDTSFWSDQRTHGECDLVTEVVEGAEFEPRVDRHYGVLFRVYVGRS